MSIFVFQQWEILVFDDPATTEIYTLSLHDALPISFAAILDAQLTGKDFVLGTDLTMADVVLGATANRWFELPIERPDLGNLAAWYERLKQRPGLREHVLHPLT